jgi:hypothetical protein
LRASERTWAVDLHSRPMDTASEELVLGGGTLQNAISGISRRNLGYLS